jgi:dienelactone hydrolase
MAGGRRAAWSRLASLWFAAVAGDASAALTERIEAVSLSGTLQRVLVVHDDAQPVTRVLIVFPGGGGELSLADGPASPPRPGTGYVASARRELARSGTAVVLVDSPARQPQMALAYRESAEYRALLKQLVEHLRTRFAGAQPYALGYSNGAVSALVAAREPGVAGVILVGGVFLRYADLAAFGAEVPLLVIHHEADRCIPPDFDESFRLRVRPTMVRSIAQAYGPAPCGPMSAHQFFGQEGVVADAIHGWLLTGRAALRIR